MIIIDLILYTCFLAVFCIYGYAVWLSWQKQMAGLKLRSYCRGWLAGRESLDDKE